MFEGTEKGEKEERELGNFSELVVQIGPVRLAQPRFGQGVGRAQFRLSPIRIDFFLNFSDTFKILYFFNAISNILLLYIILL